MRWRSRGGSIRRSPLLSTMSLLEADWLQKDPAELVAFIVEINSAIGACRSSSSSSSSSSRDDSAALTELRRMVEQQLAGVKLVDALQSVANALTTLEAAIDNFEDAYPGDLHMKLNAFLRGLREAREAAENPAVGDSLTVPAEVVLALGTFQPAGDLEGAVDESNPEVYVRRELLKLDELAAQKDVQRRRANDLRTALLQHQSAS